MRNIKQSNPSVTVASEREENKSKRSFHYSGGGQKY